MQINPFRTVEEKLEAEIKYGYIGRKFSERQKAKLMEELKTKLVVPKEQLSLVIAHCIYNEEEYLEACLEDDLKLDVDVIHITDGAWLGYKNGTAQSTDKTIEIIKRFTTKAAKVGVEVIYESKDVWQNESEKRNWQLNRIHEIMTTPYYVFVKDGDEFLHFPSGRQNVWAKRELLPFLDQPTNLGLVYCYAWYSDITNPTARFFPSKNRAHYYTGRPMTIHDKDHVVIMDYNRETMLAHKGRCFIFYQLALINYWTIRNEERVYTKQKYLDKDAKLGACEYVTSG